MLGTAGAFRMSQQQWILAAVYLVFAILFAGAAGIWVPWTLHGNAPGVTELTTFACAVSFPIVVDALLDLEDYGGRYPQSHKVVFMTGFAISLFLLYGAAINLHGQALGYSWAACVVSIAIWYWASARLDKFVPKENRRATVVPPPGPPAELNGEGLQ
jgi:hypothetical protein